MLYSAPVLLCAFLWSLCRTTYFLRLHPKLHTGAAHYTAHLLRKCFTQHLYLTVNHLLARTSDGVTPFDARLEVKNAHNVLAKLVT